MNLKYLKIIKQIIGLVLYWFRIGIVVEKNICLFQSNDNLNEKYDISSEA